jgi:signal transduction histidine kinase
LPPPEPFNAKQSQVLFQSRNHRLHGRPSLWRISPAARARRQAAGVELRRVGEEDRNPSVSGLVCHLQTVTEREKAGLARELHDELGGLLVAASMDLGWLEREIGTAPGSIRSGELDRRLVRLKECLAGAVDLKRKIIEELRPTLLDNVGLFAALRWLVSTTAARTGLASMIRFPAAERQFNPDAALALFRMAQEAIGIIIESKWVQSITVVLGDAQQRVTLSVSGRGDSQSPEERPQTKTYEFDAIRHRMAALAGGVSYSTDACSVNLSAWLPVENQLPI